LKITERREWLVNCDRWPQLELLLLQGAWRKSVACFR
jgi:hypothetical protein